MQDPNFPNFYQTFHPTPETPASHPSKHPTPKPYQAEVDEEPLLKKFPIAKLNLEKISHKISNEKSSTKPETSLESLFEDVIAYFSIDGTKEKEFSFSSEKYEQAVNFLKAKEDERRTLLSQHEDLQEKVQKNRRKLANAQAVKQEFSEKVEKVMDEVSRQEALIQKMTRGPVRDAGVQTEWWESEESSFLHGVSSYTQLPDICSPVESFMNLQGNTYKVHDSIKLYIEKLLDKIKTLENRKKKLYSDRKTLLARLSK